MAQPNADFQNIANAFVQHYYQLFDSNRAGLQSLFVDSSLMTFENEQFMGMQNIMTKLTVLLLQVLGTLLLQVLRLAGLWHVYIGVNIGDVPMCRAPQTLKFQTVAHKVTTNDAHPMQNSGIVIMVTGDLAVDGNGQTPLKFAEVRFSGHRPTPLA